MDIKLFNNKVEADSADSLQTEYINYRESGSEGTESADSYESSIGEVNAEEYPVVDYSDGDIGGTVYKKAVRWMLLAGAALMPLFFLPWTTSVLELNKQMLLVVVASVGLVLWLLDVVMSGKLSWRFNPIDKGLVALAGAVLLSAVFSVAKFKSIFGLAGSLSDSLIVVAGLTIVYFLVVNSFDDKGKAVRVFFSVSIAVSLLYGLLQIFGLHAFKYLGISALQFTAARSFNTLGSINVLGMMAAITLPMLYAQKTSVFKYLNISKLGTLVALAILVILNWWVLWTVAIVGMVSVIMFESVILSTRKESFRISKFLFPMTVIVLGIFLIIVNLNLVFIKSSLPAEIAPSYGLSDKVAWEVLKENLALGYGPENFSLAFDKFGAKELSNSSLSGVKFFDSTSHVLNLAVHGGLVGLAGLGFVLWLFGWSLFKTAKSKLDVFDSENTGTVSAGAAVIAAIFFYPFNLTLVFTLYLLLALFVLAVWGSQKRTYNIEEKASLSLVSSLGFIGGLILALVGLYFVSLNYIADFKYSQALVQTEPEKALNYVIEAVNWRESDDRFYRLSSQLALTLLSKELNTQPAKDDTQKNSRIQNYLSSAVTLAQRATQIAPNEASNWANLGDVYQSLLRLVNGSDALAEAAYLKASELRPGDPAFSSRIGNMYLLKAELLRQLAISGGASAQQLFQQAVETLSKAENAYKKSIELSNNFGSAIYNLGVVYERQGKLDEAVKQLETIAPFNGNQPGLAFELGLLYYRANKKDKALEQLQRAVVLFPDYSNARWYLALIYEERKQLDRATEQLEKILGIESNKNNEIVVKKLEELRSGNVSIPPAKVLDQKPL